jgi:F-type H+-transporting ATPase subunit epsilon
MTENSTLLLEVITPEKVFYTEKVHLVNIPGLQGELGILPGHMALIVELSPGLVSTFDSTILAKERFVISGGFAEINHKSIAILTEEAGFLEDFDSKQVDNLMLKYQEDLEFCSSEVEKKILNKKLVYYQSILSYLN